MFNIYFSYISLGYYLEYTGHFNNFSIADDLKISLDEYNEILKQYRAYEIGGSSYFKRKRGKPLSSDLDWRRGSRCHRCETARLFSPQTHDSRFDAIHH